MTKHIITDPDDEWYRELRHLQKIAEFLNIDLRVSGEFTEDAYVWRCSRQALKDLRETLRHLPNGLEVDGQVFWCIEQLLSPAYETHSDGVVVRL